MCLSDQDILLSHIQVSKSRRLKIVMLSLSFLTKFFKKFVLRVNIILKSNNRNVVQHLRRKIRD